MLVDKYKKSLNTHDLRPVLTPMTENLKLFDGHEEPGTQESRCREWVGGLLFLVRGSRPDCYATVIYLGRKVT